MLHHTSRITQPAAHIALRRCRHDLCTRVARLLAQPDDAFVHDFPAVVAAVEAGFRHEETLLELLGGTDLHPCRADHAVILSALHRTQARVESGDVALGRQVADALDAVLARPWQAGAAPVPVPAPVSPHSHPHPHPPRRVASRAH